MFARAQERLLVFVDHDDARGEWRSRVRAVAKGLVLAAPTGAPCVTFALFKLNLIGVELRAFGLVMGAGSASLSTRTVLLLDDPKGAGAAADEPGE